MYCSWAAMLREQGVLFRRLGQLSHCSNKSFATRRSRPEDVSWPRSKMEQGKCYVHCNLEVTELFLCSLKMIKTLVEPQSFPQLHMFQCLISRIMYQNKCTVENRTFKACCLFLFRLFLVHQYSPLPPECRSQQYQTRSPHLVP